MIVLKLQQTYIHTYIVLLLFFACVLDEFAYFKIYSYFIDGGPKNLRAMTKQKKFVRPRPTYSGETLVHILAGMSIHDFRELLWITLRVSNFMLCISCDKYLSLM